jgi:putative endonuclease
MFHFSKAFTGKLGENLAMLALYLKGYQLLSYDQKGRYAQVDVLAKKRQILCVVEVKVRQTKGKAHLALHPAQRERLQHQAQDWSSRYKCEAVRLDAVLIFPHWPFIEHVKNAW